METYINKVFSSEIENFGELLISADINIKKNPSREEDFHGKHTFNEDEIDIILKSVEIVIAKKGIPLLHLLNEKQKEAIISELEFE